MGCNCKNKEIEKINNKIDKVNFYFNIGVVIVILGILYYFIL